jgi:hypothetical protein
MPLWNEIEGRTLADGTVLGTLLRSEGRTAWFAATDSEGRRAVVSVFEALNDEEAVTRRLEIAARLEHPNLLKLGTIGTTRMEDESLVHVGVEPFDQTLADVLRERPLTTDEAKEVAENLLSALETVERAGLRHGHVDASGVLAVGDAIKLRSDCLSAGNGESDAPALAALLYNALTARRFSSERDAMQLPAPFASMVRAGAGSGGGLAAMRRVLTGPVVSSPSASSPATSPATASPAASSPAAGSPEVKRAAAAASGAPTAKPAVSGARSSAAAASPAVKASAPSAAKSGGPQKRRPGVAIAAAVLMGLLLVVFWLAFRRPPGHTPVSGEASVSAAPPPASASTNPAPAPNPAEQNAGAMGSAAPPPAATANRRLPASAPATAAPISTSTGGERAVWHVVAYTYARESAAKAKADELAAKYPQMEPQVFSPNGRAPYLVTLGGGMDRDAASSRRDAARKAGLPEDTYAQNFRK